MTMGLIPCQLGAGGNFQPVQFTPDLLPSDITTQAESAHHNILPGAVQPATSIDAHLTRSAVPARQYHGAVTLLQFTVRADDLRPGIQGQVQ